MPERFERDESGKEQANESLDQFREHLREKYGESSQVDSALECEVGDVTAQANAESDVKTSISQNLRTSLSDGEKTDATDADLDLVDNLQRTTTLAELRTNEIGGLAAGPQDEELGGHPRQEVASEPHGTESDPMESELTNSDKGALEERGITGPHAALNDSDSIRRDNPDDLSSPDERTLLRKSTENPSPDSLGISEIERGESKRQVDFGSAPESQSSAQRGADMQDRLPEARKRKPSSEKADRHINRGNEINNRFSNGVNDQPITNSESKKRIRRTSSGKNSSQTVRLNFRMEIRTCLLIPQTV